MSGARAVRFDILPSIDLRAGRVVDLLQGDFAQETVYEDSAEGSRRFCARRRPLDPRGRLGQGRYPANHETVQRIAAVAGAAGVKLELGGGIRFGAARPPWRRGRGSSLARRPWSARSSSPRRSAYGSEAVVVAIDARDGLVATRGWTQPSPRRAVDLAREMVDLGAVRFIYTDIARDSTLTEPNFAELEAMGRAVPAGVIASRRHHGGPGHAPGPAAPGRGHHRQRPVRREDDPARRPGALPRGDTG